MDRKVSQAKIAAAAGVSVSTVSRVLAGAPGISDRVRSSVRGVAEKLGYPVQLSPEPVPLARVIAYLADSHEPSIAPAYVPVLEAIRAATDAAGLPFGIALRERTGELPTHILEDPTVGAFLIGLDPSESAIERIVAAGTPTVLVNGLDPDLHIDSVTPANFFGGRLAARHLAELGHRRLLYVAWRQRWTLRRRAEGFLAGAGEFIADGGEGSVEVLDLPSLNQIDVFAAVEHRLATGPIDFTAVACSNDVAAMCVTQTLQARGLHIPDDVSVMGFDDVPVAALGDPPLTTVRVDWGLIGREAVRVMLHRRAYPYASAMQIQTGVSLVPRASVRQVAR